MSGGPHNNRAVGVPNITVTTTSTSFGLLPGDLSQYASWLSQYSPPTLTIYQDQSNVCSGLISISNAASAYIALHGASQVFLSQNDLQVTSGTLTLDYFGTFSPTVSNITKVTLSDSASGISAAEYGDLVYAGDPEVGLLEAGSTLSGATYLAPNPATPSSNVIAGVALSVTWNGNIWNGSTSGYYEVISDNTNNEGVQINLHENPASISFNSNTLALSTPTVNQVGLDVSDPTTGVIFDSLLITGASYAANSVPASQAIPAAIAGNDVVSISGQGSLNIISGLVNAANSIGTITLSDSAANVIANLDLLESLATLGKLASITLTDRGTPVLNITAQQKSADALALKAIVSPYSVVVPNPGLLVSLTTTQQLELIYLAYFNRAADGAGYAYWEGQNVQAQGNGESATTVLAGIANAFAPQQETEALYPSLDPYLGANAPSLNSPAGLAALTTFIDSVYANLFDRAADPAGAAYWAQQLSTGAVAIGAAALAIANGAIGSDAIEVQNKVAVAQDFTTRTSAAGLGESEPLSASFHTAAGSVLSGVDNASLNDTSVAAGESATTAYIASATTGGETSDAAAALAADPTTITVSSSNQLVDPGVGSFAIQFLAGTSADTLVLHPDGVDRVSGFDPSTDVLDVSALLRGASVSGDVATLGNYLNIVDQGADALVRFDPTGHAGGAAVVVLQGLGSVVTNLDQLTAHGAVRIA